jgi:hypothetical protein
MLKLDMRLAPTGRAATLCRTVRQTGQDDRDAPTDTALGWGARSNSFDRRSSAKGRSAQYASAKTPQELVERYFMMQSLPVGPS